MTEVVRKADVERMIHEAFQRGADDPQLIPNLLTCLRNFMPTFDVVLTVDQQVAAQAKVEDALIKFGIRT